jgi:hypothetical protein
MKRTFVMVLLALGSLDLCAQTPWVDGYDANAPANDAGRGTTDWRAHYQWAIGNGPLAAGLVKDRVTALKGAMTRGTYARMYADLTYWIASYGIKYAGWVNGSDAAAPPDDGNRGLFNWDAHYNYVMNTGGYDTANKLIGDRLATLSHAISPDDYARLYADCSVLIVNYSRMR